MSICAMNLEETKRELDRISNEILDESERICRLQNQGVPDKCIQCKEFKAGNIAYCKQCDEEEEE